MRLIDWPSVLRLAELSFISGPRAQSASESLTGFEQTVASPYGAVRFQVTLTEMKGNRVRAYKRLVAALHGGANAVRFPLIDPDQLTAAEAGIPGGFSEETWSSGATWSSGEGWGTAYPTEAVTEAAARGTSRVKMSTTYWGASDELSVFGFAGHFGWYTVTDKIDDGDFRVWPPLRKAIAVDDVVTLNPVIAARLISASDATMVRSPDFLQPPTLTFSEVPDEYVEAYFS